MNNNITIPPSIHAAAHAARIISDINRVRAFASVVLTQGTPAVPARDAVVKDGRIISPAVAAVPAISGEEIRAALGASETAVDNWLA